MRALLSALVTFTASLSLAQTSFTGGQFDVTWTNPTSGEGGRLDCSPGASTCAPLNRAACDVEDSRTLGATLAADADLGVLDGSVLYIWVEKEGDSDDACTYKPTAVSNEWEIARLELSSDDPLVSSSDFDFPDDVGDDVSLSVATFLSGDGSDGVISDACGTSGVDGVVYRLCFGVDLAGLLTDPDDDVKSTEPQAWLRILVDTTAPPKPSASATALDGRFSISASAQDEDADVAVYIVRYRELSDATSSDCTDWDDGTYQEKREDSVATSTSFDVNAANGVTYEACVILEDAVGNQSIASDVFTATPQDECDYFECYPGDLEPGYCGAAATPSLLVLLGLVRFMRRKKIS